MSEVFNRDILANNDDAELLKRDYAEIHEWLHWPELVDEFKKSEHMAAQAKGNTLNNGRKAVWWSFTAVAIITLAPLFAIYTAQNLSGNESYLATSATILFRYGWLIAVVMAGIEASRAYSGHRRQQWLDARAKCERLRQVFFQHLAQWFEHLCSNDEQERNFALAARPQALHAILTETDPREGPVASKYVNDITLSSWEISPNTGIANSKAAQNEKTAMCLYRYVIERRISYQEKHAERMLHDDKSTNTISVQSKLTNHTQRVFVLTVIFFVLQVLTGGLYFVSDWQSMQEQTIQAHTHMQLFNVLDILPLVTQTLALLAAALMVAFRAIESGLHLSNDLMRYRTYAGACNRLLRASPEGLLQTKKGRAELKRNLLAMEMLSYWEMREFLALHRQSTFSI